eukprot:5348674-Amphidinium_carterae.1
MQVQGTIDCRRLQANHGPRLLPKLFSCTQSLNQLTLSSGRKHARMSSIPKMQLCYAQEKTRFCMMCIYLDACVAQFVLLRTIHARAGHARTNMATSTSWNKHEKMKREKEKE